MRTKEVPFVYSLQRGQDLFSRASRWTIHVTGGRRGFCTAFGAILLWAALGPFFHYSDYWQLVINTGTTIVTFLMVFLIQNAQNRESKAVHLKLDELIRAVKTANNNMIDIENFTEEHLDRLAEQYHKIAAVHREFEARSAAGPHDCRHHGEGTQVPANGEAENGARPGNWGHREASMPRPLSHNSEFPGDEVPNAGIKT